MLQLAIIPTIIIFGLVTTITLITFNFNTSYLELYGFIGKQLQYHSEAAKENNETLTVIGGHRMKALMWIPQEVFKLDVFFRDTDNPKDNFTTPIRKNERPFLIVDLSLKIPLSSNPRGGRKI